MKKSVFFRIVPPEGWRASEWARKNWDSFGFDYDLEQTHDTILAWPLDSSEKVLAHSLKMAGVKFSRFIDDPNRVLGLK